MGRTPPVGRDIGRSAAQGSRADDAADSGQVMLLALAYVLVALLLVTVVVSATAVHLARKELLALADLAALEAADVMDADHYYTTDDPTLTVTQADAEEAVRAYLADAPRRDRFTNLEVVAVTTDDTRTVHVTLRAVADVPLLTAVTQVWSDGVVLEVTARARAD